MSCIQKPDKQDTGRRVKLELTQIDKFSEPLKKFLKSMSSTEIEQFPIEYRKHLLNYSEVSKEAGLGGWTIDDLSNPRYLTKWYRVSPIFRVGAQIDVFFDKNTDEWKLKKIKFLRVESKK